MSTRRLLACVGVAAGVAVALAGMSPATALEAPGKPAAASPPAKPGPTEAADEELLEFLGSLDDAEGDSAWYEWLTRNDPARVAGAKASPKKTTS